MSSNKFISNRISIVSSLEPQKRNFRLDPTQYNERSGRILRHLKSLKIPKTTIGDWELVDDVFVPGRFKRPYVESEEGIPFLGSSSMLAIHLPKATRLAQTFSKLPSLMISGGEILLSCSGTIGECVSCGESYKGFAVSQHAARIRVNKKGRGYLYAYLSSQLGRELVLQQNYGKVIKELSGDQIKQVIVPIIADPTFSKINDLMLKATDCYDLARKELNIVEENLNAFLEIDFVNKMQDQWFNREHNDFIKSPNSLFNDRLDPHFYDPNITYIRNKVNNLPGKPLGEIADVWMPNRFARSLADKGHGIPFYSSANMMRARRKPGKTISIYAEKFLKQCRVEKRMTLICRSGAFGGIMGHSTFVSSPMDGYAVTEHMIRCKVIDTEFLPEYVYGYLSSLICGYPIIAAFRHGKDVPELDPEELKTIHIPKLTPAKQELIAQHVISAFNSLDHANKLEDKAQEDLLNALQWNEASSRPTPSPHQVLQA